MSRLVRYKESINKFIKERSCIFSEIEAEDNMMKFLNDQIQKSDFLLPILFLTIMNSQNKKNHITMQGYFAASCIEFVFYLHQIVVVAIANQPDSKMINFLILASQRSLNQSMESVKNFLPTDSLSTILINSQNEFLNCVSFKKLLSPITLELSGQKPPSDLLKWYIKNDQELKEKILMINKVDPESFQNFLNNKYGSICELAFCLGWLIGGGDQKEINKIKKISKYFTILYKLSIDFVNLEKDLRNNNGDTSTNYVINYGLQESYELFMYNKQKFIEESMMIDIYTATIKEIINYIENGVDAIIDETSPDLKSQYT